MVKTLGLVVIGIAIIAIVIGVVFVVQGISKNNLIVDRMNTEKVSLALDPNNPGDFTPVNDIAAAQEAADIIAEHRRGISPTYQDLLNGGRFDSTNPTHLTYAQAMNLENYLYLAVASFGLVQVVEAAGAFMILVGIALGAVGLALRRLSKTAVA